MFSKDPQQAEEEATASASTGAQAGTTQSITDRSFSKQFYKAIIIQAKTNKRILQKQLFGEQGF
ncbi:MAG: hypothetical protein FRX49_08165 [Trebouxia sp. A1-2]|nr:MAG: hypothetical protein FRX49_08165 [Trebouxia sp. A1-2]